MKTYLIDYITDNCVHLRSSKYNSDREVSIANKTIRSQKQIDYINKLALKEFSKPVADRCDPEDIIFRVKELIRNERIMNSKLSDYDSLAKRQMILLMREVKNQVI